VRSKLFIILKKTVLFILFVFKLSASSSAKRAAVVAFSVAGVDASAEMYTRTNRTAVVVAAPAPSGDIASNSAAATEEEEDHDEDVLTTTMVDPLTNGTSNGRITNVSHFLQQTKNIASLAAIDKIVVPNFVVGSMFTEIEAQLFVFITETQRDKVLNDTSSALVWGKVANRWLKLAQRLREFEPDCQVFLRHSVNLKEKNKKIISKKRKATTEDG